MNNLIYLVGYMGCGKTTLGRKLASRMGYQFVDMDRFIEEKYFKSIPLIFAEEGEAAFRQKEQEALSELAHFTDTVISTGGGAPCFNGNMDRMNDSGTTIFIDVPPEMLASRVKHSQEERPILKGKDKDELLSYIRDALIQRRPFYEKAQYIVEGGGLTVDDLIKVLS